MRDSQCRLTILAPRPDPSTVDVSVPADCPVATVLPGLVDVVVGPADAARPHRWHLSRLTGGALDTSKTLRDNSVSDGDVLVLDAVAVPAPRRLPVDAASVVAGAARTRPVAGSVPAETTGLLVVIVLACTLAWPGGPEERLWCAAALSATAATIVLSDRRCPLPLTFSVGAALLAAATGRLAVPQSSWQLWALFGGAAACAMSLLLRRALVSVAHLAITHAAMAATAGAVAAVGAVSAAAALPVDAGGAGLALVSVAALTVAGPLAAGVAGVSPPRETVGADRAAIAHRHLTGLVTGWAAAAALGAVAVVAGGAPAGAPAVALAADVGVILTLRARSHGDPLRRIALRAAGTGACVSASVGLTLLWPTYTPWLCAAVAAGCTAVVYRRTGRRAANPVVRQSVQRVEYAALVLLVPLALWTAGLYGWVRGLGLP